MTDKLATKPRNNAALMEQVLLGGNLAQLTPADRLEYYSKTCESLGLNPLTRPFDYITLNGKMVLYAKRDATDQLRRTHGISVVELKEHRTDDLYIVWASVRDSEKREDHEMGAVSILGLKGEALANAMMKAVTKAKRRATLSICGLGWLDETEVETVADAKPVTVDTATGEIVEGEVASNAVGQAARKKAGVPQERSLLFQCDTCPTTFRSMIAGGRQYTGEEWAKLTNEAYGATLCGKCATERAKTKAADSEAGSQDPDPLGEE